MRSKELVQSMGVAPTHLGCDRQNPYEKTMQRGKVHAAPEIGRHTKMLLGVLACQCWVALPFRTPQIICGKNILVEYILPPQTPKLPFIFLSLFLGTLGRHCLPYSLNFWLASGV